MRKEDIVNTQNRYLRDFEEYGVSPKALGWLKGNQDIRFGILTSQYLFEHKSVLDIGCGFGDLINTLKLQSSDFAYTGIDITDAFVNEARKLHPEQVFISDDFLGHKFDELFDYCVASGTFNLKLKQDNYGYILSVMQKTWDISRDGFAFDFISDKVDYQLEHTFHYSPSKILDLAYSLSRNVVLRNDYMPFEFSLFVFKDDSFEKQDAVYTRYKEQRNYARERVYE